MAAATLRASEKLSAYDEEDGELLSDCLTCLTIGSYKMYCSENIEIMHLLIADHIRSAEDFIKRIGETWIHCQAISIYNRDLRKRIETNSQNQEQSMIPYSVYTSSDLSSQPIKQQLDTISNKHVKIVQLGNEKSFKIFGRDNDNWEALLCMTHPQQNGEVK